MTNKTVKELKEIAKERGLKGYSKFKKDELIELLREPTEQEKFEKTLPEEIEIITYKDNDTWLETRKLGVGGSDVASILGENKYNCAVDVYESKVNGKKFEGNRFTHWGHMLEEVVAKEFDNKHNDLKVFEYNKTFKRGRSLANVDRILFNPLTSEYGILEIKTANFFGGKEWDELTVPQSYYCQVQHYLAVTGLKFAYIACLIGGNDYREFKIERIDSECEYILQYCDEWWNKYVETKNPPPADGSDAYTKYQQEKLQYLEEITINIEGLAEKVAEYKSIQDEIKKLDKKAELIKQNLVDELIKNNAKKAEGQKHKVTVSKGRGSLDKESFKSTYPEIFNSYYEKEQEFKIEGKPSIRIS